MASVNRKAPRIGDAKFLLQDARTIKNTAHIYVGEMVGQDANLEVSGAVNAAGVVCLGVSTKEVNNANDGLTLDGISQAVHGMAYTSPHITKASIGDMMYVQDAATVEVSGTVQAGRAVEVTSDYVYVDFDPAKKAI